MFHAKDGLKFTRVEGGGVVVSLYAVVADMENPGMFKEEFMTSVTLDADTWASAVAAMSAEGDTAKGFELAREFHLRGLKRVRLEPPTAI